MSNNVCSNVCATAELNSDDTDPDNITRMIILGPKAEVSESEVVSHIHLLGLPVTVKVTCYGALVSGKKEDILKIIKEIRKLDPYNIFTRERGFPVGDPRRCRGHRHGPREGFHQMEGEYKLLEHVSDALRNPKEVSLEEKKQMNVDDLEKIFKEN
jgi:putative methanogenesis marker protein 6